MSAEKKCGHAREYYVRKGKSIQTHSAHEPAGKKRKHQSLTDQEDREPATKRPSGLPAPFERLVDWPRFLGQHKSAGGTGLCFGIDRRVTMGTFANGAFRFFIRTVVLAVDECKLIIIRVVSRRFIQAWR